MAISDFYIRNSTPRHFHTNDLDFDFKTFNTDLRAVTDMSDLSFGISTNEHAFYNDFTLGKTDAKGMFGNDSIATNVYNDAADFVSTGIRPTYCIVYYPNSQSVGYFRNTIANFKYINFTTGETNIDSPCYLVTDFQFDNIIIQLGTAQKDISQTVYASDTPLTVKEFWDGNDAALNNVYIPYLHYWTGSNSIGIDDYFELFSVIQLNGETIAYKITNNNILSTLVSPPVNQGVETDDFSGVGYVGSYERFEGKKIGDKTFNHVCTASNYEIIGDQTRNTPTNSDELGCALQPQYISPFILYYGNVCRKDYFINIVAATGLRFMNVFYTRGVNAEQYNREISIAYMDSEGIVDWHNIIKGINNINESDTKNKNIDYSTIPDIDYKKEKIDDKDHINPVDYRFTNEIGGFTRYYKVSREQLAAIVTRINTADDLPEGYEFLPHIVSVRQYPFNTSQYAMGHSENITIGGYDTGVTGLNLDSTQLAIQTLAEITVPSKYKSFLDKAPYTQLSLFIPCCGWVDLPDICTGRTITVDLAHDIINGGCIGIVKLNGMPIVQASGKMGTDISISAIENGIKQAALTQAAFNVGGGILSTGFALATGNAVGVFSGIMTTASALSQGNIANNSNYTHQIGSTGDKSNDHISTKCYLRISFPIADIPKNFAHTYGYICNQIHKISECSGFTVCDKVDLSGVNATDNEKTRLKQILETGFYC